MKWEATGRKRLEEFFQLLFIWIQDILFSNKHQRLHNRYLLDNTRVQCNQ